MSVLNGSDILLFDKDTEFPLACQKNVTITLTDGMIDATCKQSAGYSVSLPGLREFAFTADALVDFDFGVDEMILRVEVDLYVKPPFCFLFFLVLRPPETSNPLSVFFIVIPLRILVICSGVIAWFIWSITIWYLFSEFGLKRLAGLSWRFLYGRNGL